MVDSLHASHWCVVYMIAVNKLMARIAWKCLNIFLQIVGVGEPLCLPSLWLVFQSAAFLVFGVLLGWILSLLSLVVALPLVTVNIAGSLGRRVEFAFRVHSGSELQ